MAWLEFQVEVALLKLGWFQPKFDLLLPRVPWFDCSPKNA